MALKESSTDVRTGETAVSDMAAEKETALLAYAAENASQFLREERDRRLSETDVYALSDRTLSDEMRAYRQALRDLPANTSDPKNPTWPTKPSS